MYPPRVLLVFFCCLNLHLNGAAGMPKCLWPTANIIEPSRDSEDPEDTLLHRLAREHRWEDAWDFLTITKDHINAQNSKGETPLMVALPSPLTWKVSDEAQFKADRTIDVLLAQKADVNICDNSGRSALHYALWCPLEAAIWITTVLLRADAKIMQSHLHAAQDLCASTHGVGPHRSVMAYTILDGLAEARAKNKKIDDDNKSGDTPLHTAARNHIWIDLHKLLLAKCLPDTLNNQGETPLMAALSSKERRQNAGPLDMIIWRLMDARADINAKNSDGETALNYAIRYPPLDAVWAVTLLLENGAQVTESHIDNARLLFTSEAFCSHNRGGILARKIWTDLANAAQSKKGSGWAAIKP